MFVRKNVRTLYRDFLPLEKKLMQDVRQYTKEKCVETAKIINKKGFEVPIETIETKNYVTPLHPSGRILGKDRGLLGKLFNLGIKYFQSTLIHSHTVDVPLSSQDLKPLIAGAFKKVVAVTPSGEISSIERPKNKFVFTHMRKKIKAWKQFANEQTQKAEDLKLIVRNSITNLKELNFENAPSEKLKEYTDFSIHLLKNFASKIGYDFKQGQL